MARERLRHRFTEEEYFALESESDERHEYINGEIYDRAVASEQHLTLTTNLIGLLHMQTRGAGRRGCHFYANEACVQAFVRSSTPKDFRLPKRVAYYFPDVVALCGESEYREERGLPVLLNPALIIEVLSLSPQAFDSSEKAEDYRSLPSVQDFVLIAQEKMHIVHYARTGSNTWQLAELSAPDDVLTLNSISCTLTLAQIYDEVAFAEDDE